MGANNILNPIDPRVQTKIRKAEEFLASAELVRDLGAFDATVSLGSSAAINASDALIVGSAGRLPSVREHSEAVTLLRRATDRDTAAQLLFVLGLKNKAQYELRRCTSIEADAVLKRATRLVNKSKGIV